MTSPIYVAIDTPDMDRARAIAQVGYEIIDDLTLSARLSYQGRTINHAGPGAGLGVSYQW